ncbi:unnamed protein product [Orchesella dallaii]|uniref:Protein kinase domain-containing protein n=1 Tax=Orchesella dallaii TaxID=48710 RepID=A0ABP1R5F3_9HEXA
MDKREKSIIGSNLDGLVDQTICNNQLLTKLQACNILSADDVEELNILENRFKRSRAFYDIIQTRDRGFSELVNALKDTNQTGAVNILLTGKLKRENVGLESLHAIKYDISSEFLGKGLHGTVVYKGRWTNREVAIKRVNAFNDIEKNCIANEIENLRECDSHENIIRFFAPIEKPNFVYVVLELCDMTLKQWIGNQSSIQIQQREVLRQITLGLEFVHSKNILLLGMKPENVLLTRNPSKVKISGFGLSTRVENLQVGCNVTKHTVVETLGFDAPEFEAPANDEFNSQHICTFASDVYSLGCMYFYVLTSGTNDFGDLKSMENVDTDLKDIVTNEIDAQTAKDFLLIQNMISHNPTTRPSCTYLLQQPTVKSSSLNAEPNANSSTPLLSFIKKIKHKRWKDKLALSKLYEDNENLRTKITELVASCSFQPEQQHVQE